MRREKAQAAPTARPKVPMRRLGADCFAVVMKRRNARGAKGAGHRHLARVNRQREEPDNQRKAAAFVRWHEPDKSRGLRPVLRGTRGEIPGAASKAVDLGGERPLPSIARFRTASISDGRDQLTLVCSAGDRPARAKVRSLVVWMAGRRERKFSEVLKAHRQGLPWGDHESPGRNNSKRRCSLENARSEGRAHHRRAKVAWDAEI